MRHYFPTKSELFVEAMRPPVDLGSHVQRMVEGDPHLVGTRVMTFFVEVWDDPVRGPRMVALMRAALEHAEVAEFVRELIVGGVIQPVATPPARRSPQPLRSSVWR